MTKQGTVDYRADRPLTEGMPGPYEAIAAGRQPSGLHLRWRLSKLGSSGLTDTERPKTCFMPRKWERATATASTTRHGHVVIPHLEQLIFT